VRTLRPGLPPPPSRPAPAAPRRAHPASQSRRQRPCERCRFSSASRHASGSSRAAPRLAQLGAVAAAHEVERLASRRGAAARCGVSTAAQRAETKGRLVGGRVERPERRRTHSLLLRDQPGKGHVVVALRCARRERSARGAAGSAQGTAPPLRRPRCPATSAAPGLRRRRRPQPPWPARHYFRSQRRRP
jgi:hypothetical protein